MTTMSSSERKRSLARVKNELQTVIDLMGTSTPQFSGFSTINTSSEADNEDSALSSLQPSHESSESCSTQKFKVQGTGTDFGAAVSESTLCDSSLAMPKSKPSRERKSSKGEESEMMGVNYETFKEDHNVDGLDRGDTFVNECPCHHAPMAVPHICGNPTCMSMMGYLQQQPQPYIPATCPAHQDVCCEAAMDVTNSRPTRIDCRRRSWMQWIKQASFERMMRQPEKQPCELYKIDMTRNEEDGSPPRRLIFDLVEGIPKPDATSVATNTKKMKMQQQATQSRCYNKVNAYQNTSCYCPEQMFPDDAKAFKEERNSHEKIRNGGFFQKRFSYNRNNNNNGNNNNNTNNNNGNNNNNIKESNSNMKNNNNRTEEQWFDSNGDTKVDFYYFDHGNAQYFHTTDAVPIMYCDLLAERTEKYTTKFWSEIFATLHVVTSFCTSFVLQFFRFVLYSLVRPLTVGLMQLGSDYFFKPCLTTLFNGLLQPILIFCYNIATSFRDLCDPLAEGIGYFFRECAVVLRAIRVVSVRKNNYVVPQGCRV